MGGRFAAHLSLPLEEELQSTLHGSRCATRATELPELRTGEVIVQATERLPVERIEHLPAELQLVSLGEVEILAQAGIPTIPTGIEQSGWVTTHVTFGALCRNYELGFVEIRGCNVAEVRCVAPIARLYRMGT